ncbi:RNA polymerase sigma factor [Flavobacteriales bacterium]|nr:RNA polymerase sigma factor [Flavobacteriales bacterium]
MNLKDYNKSVDLYADRLYRFVFKNMRDSERAQDVVQDVFEKVWNRVDEISAEKIKSYLFTAAYHTMLDVIKKDKRISHFEDERKFEQSYSKEYSGVNEILENALNTLSEIQKNVILLRDYEGYSYEEIGEITNLKDSQVKVYIYIARKALQKYLVSIETVLG